MEIAKTKFFRRRQSDVLNLSKDHVSTKISSGKENNDKLLKGKRIQTLFAALRQAGAASGGAKIASETAGRGRK
jgi:hypothetical protein